MYSSGDDGDDDENGENDDDGDGDDDEKKDRDAKEPDTSCWRTLRIDQYTSEAVNRKCCRIYLFLHFSENYPKPNHWTSYD